MAILNEILAEVVPSDHARQVHVRDEFVQLLQGSKPGVKVLDVGCGDGRGYAIVKSVSDSAIYNGIDIEDSPEVRSRTMQLDAFQTFDGVNIPFGDASFDIVYSCSVLEHVRHPDKLMKEVSRVLKNGGIFIGSVSFLEPYHSYSIFNFTPYGLLTVMKDAGLTPLVFRPGIDGLTLTTRTYGFWRNRFNKWFHSESPVNRLITLRSRLSRKTASWENAIKLQACGQIVFTARRMT